MITDTLTSYDAAHRVVMPTVEPINAVYANNRAEVSQPTHAATRISYARVVLFDSGSTVFDVTRTHTESLSSRPPPHAGGPLSTVAHPGLSGLGGSGVRISNVASLVQCAHRLLS